MPSPYPALDLELLSVTAWENGVVRLRFGSQVDGDLNSEREDHVS